MAAKTNIFSLQGRPGIKRDGTDLDNEFFLDGQWVRWQRGRPKKMGGYRAMSSVMTGPMRNVLVDARASGNTAHVFSSWGIEQLSFDFDGAGAGVVDRTPAGLAYNVNRNWQSDSMYQNGGGGFPVVVAAAAPNLDSVSSDVTAGVYSGDVSAATAFTQIADGAGNILVSGGCVVLQPFLFVYGSNGLIRNSNANDFSVATGWSGVNANTGNFSGSKIVKGLPVRGGTQTPAGLFWALDSLIRVSYIGGTALWKYDPVGAITVLSSSAMIEYDGVFYWPGSDRFYAYTGVVQELPNDMNLNYFYDNLNYAAAQRVWAQKVPRYGEIWWFYPSGTNTECDKAIIYNVREKTWYDAALVRSAGAPAQVFRFPVQGGGDALATTYATYTAGAGTLNNNEVVTGGTSGAVGTIVRLLPGKINLVITSGTFVNGEVVTGTSGATGTLTSVPATQELNTLWQHEYGWDQVKSTEVTAIQAYFETSNFQWATGGPAQDAPQGATNNTRLTKFEPDFLSAGALTLTVRGRKYAQAAAIDGTPYPFTEDTEYIPTRDQARLMSLKLESNVAGGYFEGGRNLMTIEPGDERA